MGRSFRRNRRALTERCPGGWWLRTASRGHWRLRGGAGFSLACCSGGRFQRFTPRGVVVVAWRDRALLVSGPGRRFLRFTPRGMLRWCGTRGALRPLFLLRSCAADQEKRPEKKSWAVTACVSLRLERLRDTCIRSAPRCISRGQRKKAFFWLRGKRF